MNSTRYPARYLLQRQDGTTWTKLGNGANIPAPLFARMAKMTVLPNPRYRVWDRLEGREVTP